MPKLVFLSGPRAGETVEVDHEQVIGRVDADITISDPKLSRRHALVRPREGQLELKDLDSLNGTFHQDRRITEPALLQDGDEFRLGNTEARAVCEPASPALTVLDVADAPEGTVLDVVEPRPDDLSAPREREGEALPDLMPFGAGGAGGQAVAVKRRTAASLLWLPTALTLAVILATAVAEVLYFAAR